MSANDRIAKLLAVSLTLATAAFAEEPAAVTPAPAAATQVEANPGFLKRWNTFVRAEVDRIIASEPYGSTFQLPKGYLKIKYGWASLHGDSRYDGAGKLGPLIPRLEFNSAEQSELSIDLGVSGTGGSHTFQIGYGIEDNLGWFAEIPYSYMNLRMDPVVNEVDAEGNHIGPTAAQFLGVNDRKSYGPANFLYETLPLLGRPPLASGVRGSWLLGDVNTGLAWNYYRTPRMAAGLTGRVFLPTAHIPPAERNIMYATGPEVEVGVGGWGVAAAQGYDLRAYRNSWMEVVASSELAAGYRFPQERAYPTNFIKPDPVAAGLSPQMFPDLSNLEGTFKLSPGWGASWNARVDVGLALFGISAGYGVRFNQKPQLEGDAAFLGMVDALGLLGESEVHTVQVGAGISLIPLAIPARLTVDWQRVIGGRNVILYENHITVGVDGFIPTQFFFRR